MSLQEFIQALNTLQDFSLYSESGMDKHSAKLHSELAVMLVKRPRLLRMYSDMNLLELLMDCSEMDCSDPRDRLFALSSLDRNFSILPDYSKNYTDICIYFAQLLIQKCHIGTVFRNLRYNRDSIAASFPTWVPDLCYPFSTLNRGHEIDAALNVCFEANNTLSLQPFYVGLIFDIRPSRKGEDGDLHFSISHAPHDNRQYTYYERESENAAHLFQRDQVSLLQLGSHRNRF